MANESFTIITTLRYAAYEPFEHPDNGGPADLYRLDAHLTRLEESAKALGWTFSSPSLFAAGEHNKVAKLARLIRAAVGRATKSSSQPLILTQHEAEECAKEHTMAVSKSEVMRVRIDLSSPPSGGLCSFTVAPVVAMPRDNMAVVGYGTFDIYFPERLPSPAELGGEHPPAWRVFLLDQTVDKTVHTERKTSQRGIYNAARKGLQLTDEVLLVNHDGEIMDASISTPYLWIRGQWITPAATCGGQIGVSRAYALAKGLAVEGLIRPQDIVFPQQIWLSNGLRGFSVGILQKRFTASDSVDGAIGEKAP